MVKGGRASIKTGTQQSVGLRLELQPLCYSARLVCAVGRLIRHNHERVAQPLLDLSPLFGVYAAIPGVIEPLL
jgi:hypothetical protein